jgi:hypothetical protein
MGVALAQTHSEIIRWPATTGGAFDRPRGAAASALLDEPAAGLDPIARRSLNECLWKCCSAVMTAPSVSTHSSPISSGLRPTSGFMDRGRLMAAGKSRIGKELCASAGCVCGGSSFPWILGSRLTRNYALRPSGYCNCTGPDDQHLAPIRAIPGVRINVFPLTLEEVFVELFVKCPR